MSAYRTAIIVDSTCDIPAEWRSQYQLKVIPMTLIWGEEQYLDGVEMTAEAFYERLLVDPAYPRTSMPAPGIFLQAYEEAAAAGAENIMVFTLSSAMSGTYNSARQAAEGFRLPVTLMDSKTNSMGLGWQVMAAARAREAGGDIAAMAAASEQARKNMLYVISLDTLEYLAKGGRIAGAAKFLSSVLNIKPQISVNHETGKVEAGMPSRSRARAVEGLYKDFFQRLKRTGGAMHITVLHNAAYEEAAALAKRVREEVNPEELIISIVSPVLGVHTGPRAIALVGYCS